MNLKFLKTVFVLSMLTLAFSCGEKAKEAETKEAEAEAEATTEAVYYRVDAESSSVAWKGFKPTGSHDGSIAVSVGKFTVKEGMIESGEFEIDMNSIKVLDIPVEDDGNESLRGHLAGPDFFDVEKYPRASFAVTGMKSDGDKTYLNGNLTLKDATNNISIPVNLEENENGIMLKSETFTIDRSKWNVKYGSKSFFDNLGEKFINHDIELTIDLKANKA